MLKIFSLATAALLALTVPLIAQDGGPVLHVIEAQDQITQIRARTRHTTVIVLPPTETVLDFVVGDSEYWHLTGAANLAFLKPITEGVTTNVALVCASGNIYSFLVTEQSAGDPHLVVRVEAQADADTRISPTRHEPAFVARSQVAAYQQMAEAQSDQAFIEALRGTPIAPEAAPVVPAATAGSATARDSSSPVRIGEPGDPPGWERIYEGSFLEAALVT